MTTKKKKTEENKELVRTAEETLPSYMQSESKRGQENVEASDLSIPRLDLVQALSPQRKKTAPEYIEGAEEGVLFNSVTQELYGTTVSFVPVFFRKEYLIWKDRKSGGGFAGSFPTQMTAEREAAKLGRDYEVQETAMHFGMVLLEDGSVDEVVVTMARAKLKASRQLNTLCRMARGDRFGSAYLLSAVEVNGDKGDYFNYTVKRIGYVDEETYKMGEKLYEDVSSGSKDVNFKEEEEEEEEEEGTPAY